MKRFFLPLILLFSCSSLYAQSTFYVNMTNLARQFNSTVWKNAEGAVAFSVYTSKRDILGDRKDAIIYQESKEKYSLERKQNNRILRDTDNGNILVFRPHKYVLPNGRVLVRYNRKFGRAIVLEDRDGNIIASATIVRVKGAPRRLEIAFNEETGHNDILAGMLSLDIIDQYRNIAFSPPIIII